MQKLKEACSGRHKKVDLNNSTTGWYTRNECLCDSDGDIVDYPQEDYMPHLPSWS
ncbi:unnamed protein product [Eretmochelys imbricata]